ncbi:unnamed protein product [Nesidiocoris tenuis]|uniref:Uncharacterized protein n=1 Tax=Nesidiocoris tenuis TaxID=355587 RepID=A0A6H5GS02_9HEMI|nr:unnamed protein product [Nesidiocoris tenuis]
MDRTSRPVFDVHQHPIIIRHHGSSTPESGKLIERQRRAVDFRSLWRTSGGSQGLQMTRSPAGQSEEAGLSRKALLLRYRGFPLPAIRQLPTLGVVAGLTSRFFSSVSFLTQPGDCWPKWWTYALDNPTEG